MNLSDYQGYEEKKEHSTGAFPYNTYLCTIPLDFPSVPLHWHEDVELIVIKKGQGSVTVDLQTCAVRAGDLILVMPGHLHAIDGSEGCTMEYENILFRPSLLSAGKQDLCSAMFLDPLFGGQTEPETVCITPALSWYQEIWNLILEINRLCDRRPTGYQLAVKGCLFQFFFLLAGHLVGNGGQGRKPKVLGQIKKIVQYVEEHFSEKITIGSMAALTSYSKSHFMKFFRTNMGCGFTGWLNDYRLTMAARMLILSDESILEVSEAAGFSNLSYFNRLFRAKYRTTPLAYRKHGTPEP